jgi:hypothetical protein
MEVTNQDLAAHIPADLTVASVVGIKLYSPQTYGALVYVPYEGAEAVANLNALMIETLVEQGLPVPENLTIGWGTAAPALGWSLVIPAEGKPLDNLKCPVEMYLEPETHKFTAQRPEDGSIRALGVIFSIDVLNPHYIAKAEVVANEQLSSSI